MNHELDETLPVDPLRPNEGVCSRCRLVYNADGLESCPSLDCEAER